MAVIGEKFDVLCNVLFFPSQSYAFIRQEQLQALAEKLDSSRPKEVEMLYSFDNTQCLVHCGKKGHIMILVISPHFCNVV